MKRDDLLILCGLGGGLLVLLSYFRYMVIRRIRAKRLRWYMQHFYRRES